jgi:hypothetical protein
MKRFVWTAVLLIVPVLLVAGCGGDDNNPTGTTADPIVGTWVSEGTNVAPGLVATFKTKKITATFNKDQTYDVVAVDSSDVSVTYQGTYTGSANSGTDIRSIALDQNVPSAVTSEGIYQVAGTTLTYEVIQVQPALLGFTPPVASEGFGSTKYNGTPLGVIWIQTFVKQ